MQPSGNKLNFLTVLDPSAKRNLLAVNIFLSVAGLVALFFLLTNGVPMIQAGWMEALAKKNRYERLMMIPVSVFFVLVLLARVMVPRLFPKTWLVSVWTRFCLIPVRWTTVVLFLLYGCLMALVGFERHLALETRAFDLGIFAQSVWNTMNGDFLFSSIKENICLLGDHVSPILIFTAPFYAIWPDPRTLILLQALAAASSFFPLMLIARDKVKDRSLVLIFLLMFFFYQPMRAALHEDFHPEVLAEPFLWWAFLFLERKHVVRFLFCLAIAVTGKENFLGIAFMLGFYAFAFKNMRGLGAVVMAASVGLFIWETKWLIPHLTGVKYFYGGNYSIAISDPVNGIVKKLAQFGSLGYAFKVFLPFLFLPFFHFPTLVLTFPVFFQNLISANPAMRSFNYHYFTGLTPFLFISTIYAFSSLRDRWEWFRRHALPIGFVLLTVGLFRSGPSEYWFFWNINGHRSAHADMVREKLRQIPPDARVLTHNSFIPQLCNRKYIYQFNYNPEPSKLDFANKYAADTVIWDKKFLEPDTQTPTEISASLKDGGYAIAFEEDGLYVFKKKNR